MLAHAAGQSFYNTSKHTFATLLADPDNVAGNLRNYIAGFSESARDIIDKFNFDTQIDPFDRTQTCCIWWFRSSPTSTCVPTTCQTWRWATSTRS